MEVKTKWFLIDANYLLIEDSFTAGKRKRENHASDLTSLLARNAHI